MDGAIRACYSEDMEDCYLRRASLFFFQAEDGIRALIVTGVQTCALPISTPGAWGARVFRFSPARTETKAARPPGARSRRDRDVRDLHAAAKVGEEMMNAHLRSEERRVGEEWRSRWAPDH